jgi:hypothetical protein
VTGQPDKLRTRIYGGIDPEDPAVRAWVRRQLDKAPPATPEQVAAVRRALLPRHPRTGQR